MTAMMLLKANCLLIVENAKIMKGMFITTKNIDNDVPVSSVKIREIPVTPPSINELGSKNPFNPKQADNIPNKIKKLSRII